MKKVRTATVLVAILAIGILGGTTLQVAHQMGSTGGALHVDFDGDDGGDGDDPPSDPDSIPGGDPEHPT